MRRTGRTDIDLAILTYDERLMGCTRPAGGRRPSIPRYVRWQRGRTGPEGERFLTVRKAIDVRG